MKINSCGFSLLLCLAACPGPKTPSGPPPAHLVEPYAKPQGGDQEASTQLVLQVDRPALVAGGLLRASCAVWRNGVPQPEEAVRAHVEPRQPVADYTANVTQFRMEQAGTYRVWCQAAQQIGPESPAVQPTQVQVMPAAASQVRAILSSQEEMAGHPVTFRCAVADAFGNPTSPEPLAGPLALEVRPASQQRPEAGGPLGPTSDDLSHQVVVQGNQLIVQRAGTFLVQCDGPGLPAAAAVPLRIVPAATAYLELELADSVQRAGEPFAASCHAFDAFGNSRDVPDSTGQPIGLVVTPHRVQQRACEAANGQITLYTKGTYSLQCESSLEAPHKGGQRLDVLRSEPREVHLRPGLPHSIDAASSGWRLDNACLPEEMDQNFSAYVYDAFNNLLDGEDFPALDIGVQPLGVTGEPPTVKSRGVVFHAPGSYRLSAQFQGPFAAGSALDRQQFRREVYVNSTLPTIEVDSPQRASQLLAMPGTEVRIEGSIFDRAGLRSVRVQGRSIALDKTPQRLDLHALVEAPHWGVNTVEVEATNCCGITSRRIQTFTYSPQYVDPTQDSTGAAAARALKLQVGASMLRRPGEDPSLASVARLMEQALSPRLVSERMPELLYEKIPTDRPAPAAGQDPPPRRPLTDWARWLGSAFRQGARRGQAWIGQVRVERAADVLFDFPAKVEGLAIEPVDAVAPNGPQQLVARLRLTNLVVPLKLQASRLFGVAKLRVPELTADVVLQIDAEGRAQVRQPDGVKVRFAEGRRIEWGSGSQRDWRLHWPMQGLVDMLQWFGRKDTPIEDYLAISMRDAVLRALGDALGALDWLEPLTPPAPLAGGVKFARVRNRLELHPPAADSGAHLSVAIDGHLLPTATEVPLPLPLLDALRPERPYLTPGRGAIRHAPEASTAGLPEDMAFGILLHDDIINEFFWSLWQSGAFFIPELHNAVQGLGADAQRLLNGSRIGVYAAAPPVWMPSDQPHRFTLSWGDLLIDAQVNTASEPPPEGPTAGSDSTDLDRVPVTLFVSLSMEVELGLDSTSEHLKVRIVGDDLPPPQLKVQTVHLPAHGDMATQASLKLQIWLARFIPALLQQSLDNLPLPAVDISAIVGAPAKTTGWRIDNGRLTRPAGGCTTLLQGGVQLSK